MPNIIPKKQVTYWVMKWEVTLNAWCSSSQTCKEHMMQTNGLISFWREWLSHSKKGGSWDAIRITNEGIGSGKHNVLIGAIWPFNWDVGGVVDDTWTSICLPLNDTRHGRMASSVVVVRHHEGVLHPIPKPLLNILKLKNFLLWVVWAPCFTSHAALVSWCGEHWQSQQWIGCLDLHLEKACQQLSHVLDRH